MKKVSKIQWIHAHKQVLAIQTKLHACFFGIYFPLQKRLKKLNSKYFTPYWVTKATQLFKLSR